MPSSQGHAVLYDQCQCFGVDVKEIAVDIDVLRCSFRFPQKSCVSLEGRFIVCNRDIAWFVESRDFDALLVAKSFDQAFGSERCGSAVGVMYHNDVLDSEQMLSYRYGTQRVHRPSTGYY